MMWPSELLFKLDNWAISWDELIIICRRMFLKMRMTSFYSPDFDETLSWSVLASRPEGILILFGIAIIWLHHDITSIHSVLDQTHARVLFSKVQFMDKWEERKSHTKRKQKEEVTYRSRSASDCISFGSDPSAFCVPPADQNFLNCASALPTIPLLAHDLGICCIYDYGYITWIKQENIRSNNMGACNIFSVPLTICDSKQRHIREEECRRLHWRQWQRTWWYSMVLEREREIARETEREDDYCWALLVGGTALAYRYRCCNIHRHYCILRYSLGRKCRPA